MTVDSSSMCTKCGRAFASAGQELCLACLAYSVRQSLQGPAPRVEDLPGIAEHSIAIPDQTVDERAKKNSDRQHRHKVAQREKKRKLAAEQKAQREALLLLANKGRRNRGLNCILCGAHIPRGELLKHKEVVHGETHVPLAEPTRKPNVWVPVVSGGLPSLGKKR